MLLQNYLLETLDGAEWKLLGVIQGANARDALTACALCHSLPVKSVLRLSLLSYQLGVVKQSDGTYRPTATP